jgi:hypothetical protein
LITGILEFKYDPEQERTLWKRRQAQRLAKSSNLSTEGKPTTEAMGDDLSGRDYCGKVSIKQEPKWSPPSNHNNSEGIFWDDLADIELESQGDNFSDVSKPRLSEPDRPVGPGTEPASGLSQPQNWSAHKPVIEPENRPKTGKNRKKPAVQNLNRFKKITYFFN